MTGRLLMDTQRVSDIGETSVIGQPIEVKANSLICCVCKNASALQPPGVTEWVCGNCARLGLVWAAKQAQQAAKVNKPWWSLRR